VNEWAVHLDDVMVRRTSWRYYHQDAVQKADRVADWMAELLDWSDATRADEIERYRAMAGCQPAAESSSSRETQRRNDQRAASVA
jgi:glycerol-3-phosphate dehydrogenase